MDENWVLALAAAMTGWLTLSLFAAERERRAQETEAAQPRPALPTPAAPAPSVVQASAATAPAGRSRQK